MTKQIPYKYYKLGLLMTWALAVLCVIATWLGFSLYDNSAAFVFAAIVDSFLTLSLIFLIVILMLSGRRDYKMRGYIFIGLTIAHLIFFICCLALSNRLAENWNNGYFALPIIHTALLIAISVIGIYFWIRNKFTFKSMAKEDAQAAFGGPIEDPEAEKYKPLEPEEPKQARDEKTGIVSL